MNETTKNLIIVKLDKNPNEKLLNVTEYLSDGKIEYTVYTKEALAKELEKLISKGIIDKGSRVTFGTNDQKSQRPGYTFHETDKVENPRTYRLEGPKEGITPEDTLIFDRFADKIKIKHLKKNVEILTKNNSNLKKGKKRFKLQRNVAILALVAFATFPSIGKFMGNTLDEMAVNSSFKDLNYGLEFIKDQQTQGENINIFGEKWTDELYKAYKENLKDNKDTPGELEAWEKYFAGEDLKVDEKRDFLNEFEERHDDYIEAKEELGMKR